jgi:transcriptional regulator with XRE-family HTH domain
MEFVSDNTHHNVNIGITDKLTNNQLKILCIEPQADGLAHNMKKLLKDRIRQARLTSGFSQLALAEKIGIQRSAVAQWERVDGSRPTVENLCKLATITSVRFEWLATGRGNRTLTEVEDHSLGQEVQLMYLASTDLELRTLKALRKLTLHEANAITELAESLAMKSKHKKSDTRGDVR